jgi:hypothetical protein
MPCSSGVDRFQVKAGVGDDAAASVGSGFDAAHPDPAAVSSRSARTTFDEARSRFMASPLVVGGVFG